MMIRFRGQMFTAYVPFVVCLVTVGAAAQERVAIAPAAPLFVAIAPCRILDTRMKSAANSREEVARDVDLERNRCGRIVPPYAISYSLRIITIDKIAPEKLPSGAGPQTRTLIQPATSNRRLNFPVPSGFHVAVDVDGYYVPAGTPINPSSPAATVSALTDPGAGTISSAGIQGPRTVQPLNDIGSKGEIRTDGSNPDFPSSGVAMKASTASPSVTVQTGSASSAYWFGIYNSVLSGASRRYALFKSDGNIELDPNTYLNGRSDYFGSGDISTGNVHDVTINQPNDTFQISPVTFYNAHSDMEPYVPTTKFKAHTDGYYTPFNINFDSHIVYHKPNQYHFRAYSLIESKETFWVKAAANNDSVTGTRADMYISGNVGVGTMNPGTLAGLWNFGVVGRSLQVTGEASQDAVLALSAGSARFPRLIMEDQNSTAGKRVIEFIKTANLLTLRSLSESTGGSVVDPIMTWDTTNGRVGIGTAPGTDRLTVNGNVSVIGTIYANYQDVAEWVPAAQSMSSGTVVVLSDEASNTVTPSTHAYDTGVAGVVSPSPGLLLGIEGPSKAKIATTGRVRVRVDANKAPIRRGDLLVTSDRPGMAMKSEPMDISGVKFHRPGTLIGKALEPLGSGEGEILVLLSLQ
jgi:hypothetical protein